MNLMYEIFVKKIVMALQKLLGSDLVFITLIAVTSAHYDMRQFIEPDYYGINLTLRIEENYVIIEDIYNKHKQYILDQFARHNFIFYADFEIIFKISQETQYIYLHAYNLEAYTSSQLFYFNAEKPQEIKWSRCWNDIENQIIAFSFNDKIPLGMYKLKMKYIGATTNHVGGIFKTSYIDENGDKTWLYAAGNFLPYEIRQVFPCWDKPSIRVIIHFLFIGSPQSYTVLTGLPGFTDKGFSGPFVTSIYRIAFVVSRLYRVSNANETVNIWCRKQIAHHTEFAQNVTKNITLTFSKWGYDLNVIHVAIPGFRNEGIDSWNLILYSEAAVTYDERSDPIMQQTEVARVIGYKMIHYILDRDRAMSSWSDLWIIEGIAMFYGAHIIDMIIPNIRMMDLFIVQAKYETLRWDAYSDMPIEIQDDALSSKGSIWFYPRYLKAFLLMFMMQHITIDNIFFDIIRTIYFNLQYFSNNSNRFWYEIESALNDFNNKIIIINDNNNVQSTYNFNITKMMSGWTKQRHYPVLKLKQNNTNEVIIKISPLNNFNISYQRNCWIPVTYITQTSSTINHILKIYWISPEHPYLHLKLDNDDDWIIVNAQQAGYYRVCYDMNNWNKIIYYLSTKNYINIPVLNRAQLVDDVYYFLSMGNLHYSLFQQIIHYLSKETDYIVWYTMFKNMEHMSPFFVFPESTELKQDLQNILDKLIKKIGQYENPIEYYMKCLREEALKWACLLGSTICKRIAVSQMLIHIQYKTINLSPLLIDWTYCSGISSEIVDSFDWIQLLNQYETLLQRDNKFLEHLTCTTDPDNIKNYLRILPSYTKFDIYTKPIPNRFNIFLSIVAKHANKNEVLKFILMNFDTVRPSEINPVVAVIVIIDHVYNESKLEQIKNCTRRNIIELFPYVQRKTEQRLSQIKHQINVWKFFDGFKRLK